MTPKRINDLAAAAATKRFRNEAAIDRWLDEQRVYGAEQRIAAKHALMAQGLLTDRAVAPGALATDTPVTPEAPPISPEMRALFRKARLEVGRSYSQTEVDQALGASGLDVTSKIAIRTELAMRRQVRASGSVQASGPRSLSAAAERPRGKVLTDRRGQPLVLRSVPA